MKKLSTLLIAIAIFIGTTNATVYYVDALGGNNTGTAETWTTAVKNIEQAQVLADANPGTDDIYVKGGILSFPGSSLVIRATNDVNVYGSFQGIENETPSTRPLTDIDGNGIIEPWEFQFPTLISSTNPNNALTLAAAIFDGFTITHIGTKTTGVMSSIVGVVGATFQNNIIKNSLINITINGTSVYDGILIKANGTFKNCLIEKNVVNTIIAFSIGGTDKYFAPIMGITGGATVTGCVFRNNKGIIDCSGPSAGATGSVKGVIVNLYGAVSGSTYLTNCLIYNNEVVYVPGTATGVTATLASGCIVGTAGLGSTFSSNYILNCTIANNKLTNTGNGGAFLYNNNAIINYFENNALWNNQLGGVVKNLAINSNVTTGRIGFNVMNKGNNGTYTLAATLNNVVNLNITNADSITSPRFKMPTTFVGCNRVGGSSDSTAIAKADWRLNVNSYLIGKGLITTVLTDKAGNLFATPPTVGAYEFVPGTAVFPVFRNLTNIAYVKDAKIISKQEGYLQIFNLTGSVIWYGNVVSEQKITLPCGCYLIRLTSAKEQRTQKIVL